MRFPMRMLTAALLVLTGLPPIANADDSLETPTPGSLLLIAELPSSVADRIDDIPRAVSERLEKLVPGTTPDSIARSQMDSMYEIRFGSTIIYLSSDGRYMMQGDLINLESGHNLTEDTRSAMRTEAIEGLGETSMIAFTPENAENAKNTRHTVTVFTDVECGYCVRLHQQMADYNQLGIAIRYVAYPRAGIGSPVYDTMVSVWCAADRQTAMTHAKAQIPIEEARCDNPVEEHYEAGRAIGVRGTPALVLESGELISGYIPPEELAKKLDELDSRPS